MASKASLRELIKVDRPVLGISCTVPSSQIIEIFCSAGAEFLFIDTEHTLVDRATLHTMLQAADIWQVPVIVRAAWNAPELIGWPLDFGAEGIAVPMISNARDAEAFVHAARYAPTGERSFGGASPLVFRSGGVFDAETANRRTVCMAMIETQESVENIDAIARVDGIDAIFVGQSDLGIAYGLHPSLERDNPKHLDRLKHIAEVSLSNDVAPFIVCDKVDSRQKLQDMGYRFFMKSDVSIFLEGAKAAVDGSARLDAGKDDFIY